MKQKDNVLIHYPIALLDYLYVIIIYVSISFWLAVLIDGHILPKFDIEKEKKDYTIILYSKVMLQLALQGFIVIVVSILLQKLPSPLTNIMNYDPNSKLGLLIRNPAIMYIILFVLSKSLQARLIILYSRFNKNALVLVK